ncbi:MAG: hypothetical protein JHD01_05760 [Candidatus Nanopelagicales bacterium]|nr:hypothetical protein [Candidatus Nanopelagicales bacterium]
MASSNNPTVTLPGSGLTVRVRRQPGDMLKLVEASARRGMESSKPEIPTQKLEVGPNEFSEIEDINNPEYIEALGIYEANVQEQFAKKMLDVVVKVGIIDTPDKDELESLRETYKTLEIETPPDDREFWVQFVVAPSAEDFSLLIFEIFGKSLPTEAQVAFHRTLFQRNVETASS